MKRCPQCLETKALTEFYTNKARGDGYCHYCKVCHAANGRKWSAKNKGRKAATQKRWQEMNPERRWLLQLRRYGITPEQYDAMLTAQGGGCAVCGIVETMHVDHDHACCDKKNAACGQCVRGLLCGPCNRALGIMGDSPARLRAAADYIEASVPAVLQSENNQRTSEAVRSLNGPE